MNVKITYNGISGEQLEALLENENVEKVEILSDNNHAVEEWLEDHNINGDVVSYAYTKFCNSNAANMSLIKFSKAVRATGRYTTKNLRIGDCVQRCFVALDGHEV